jgi:hypothetical protein
MVDSERVHQHCGRDATAQDWKREMCPVAERTNQFDESNRDEPGTGSNNQPTDDEGSEKEPERSEADTTCRTDWFSRDSGW